MITVTDMHTHVLPGIDDGSGSLQESLAMLRASAAQGVKLVAATPHFDPRRDTPERFLSRRDRAAEKLLNAVEPNMPRLILGAEVCYFRGISECEQLPLLTLEGGKALLLELPLAPWPREIWQELALFQSRTGIIPIIAHVERYFGLLYNRDVPDRLCELPVLMQANSNFFLRKFTAPMALRLLREDKIQLLGSDCHGARGRKPNMGSAMERIGHYAKRIRKYEQTILPAWAEEIYQGEKEITV